MPTHYYWIRAAVIWFCCALISEAIAEKRGVKLIYFVVGLIFGPLAIIMAVSTPGTRISCPTCKEFIDKNAAACPHCQRDIMETTGKNFY